MSGLFRRIRRTRAAAAEDSRPKPPAPSEPRDVTATAEFQGGQPPLADMRDLPAGLAPEELRWPQATTERRARVRRRTRYLRRVRELLLRDLGGLVYEIHRAAGGDRAHQEALVRAKAERIAALDGELYALEERLGSGHPETVLREPGVGGTCPTCGELHSSHARFCSSCGRPLTGRTAEPAAAAEPGAPVPEGAPDSSVEGNAAPTDAVRFEREALRDALPVERGAAATGDGEATPEEPPATGGLEPTASDDAPTRVDREAALSAEEPTRVEREAALSGEEPTRVDREAAVSADEPTRVEREAGASAEEPTRVRPESTEPAAADDEHPEQRFSGNGRSSGSDLATPAERQS